MPFLKEPHFNEIKRALSDINSKTLTDRLRFLESKKIVIRNFRTNRPIRVTYKMTEFGEGLIKLFLPLLFYIIRPNKSLKKK
ncbi:MAG: winged helix-turn-helix transcriptional regulator [Promethearchaeota archaeon]